MDASTMSACTRISFGIIHLNRIRERLRRPLESEEKEKA